MKAVVCKTEQVLPKASTVGSRVKWYRKILTKFKCGGLVKIHQFIKFSSLSIFILIWYIGYHGNVFFHSIYSEWLIQYYLVISLPRQHPIM